MIHAGAPEERVAVRMVDALVFHALTLRASDIHAEPQEERLRIRYRIDGLLVEQEPIDESFTDQIVARIKVLAGMNPMQRRIPQDGTFTVEHAERAVDIRVATFPSVYGETVVLRLLDQTQQPLTLAELGLSDDMQQEVAKLLRSSQGLFLVTGPTGSGKTTTLYAALSSIDDATKNIITLEDPVEYVMPHITQGHVDPEVGFTFETGIRAMLRQDPDIMLVGEIRDRQTARIAIEAALTGHLVLSTVHTSDAPTALIRIMEMDIEPFLLKASLIGILAQRLVRRVCSSCVQYVQPTHEEAEIFRSHELPVPDQLPIALGCDHCVNTGYYGRVGVFELLTITDALRSLMQPAPDILRINIQATADGLKPLLVDGLLKVTEKMTTMHEIAQLMS
jgi:type II secretory ATPase GspE/PulE/Tfp pilus assembly ATPase PilB-like protein